MLFRVICQKMVANDPFVFGVFMLYSEYLCAAGQKFFLSRAIECNNRGGSSVYEVNVPCEFPIPPGLASEPGIKGA